MRALYLLLLIVTACGPRAAAPAAPASTAEDARDRHREVHWVRSSAEYRALTLQVYRAAADELRRQAPTLAAGTWAVIMDADETILDNSDFERRIAETGEPFHESLWDEWVLEEAATAVPGAADFIRTVYGLGGRVAVVTNRDQRLCPSTERNLDALGIRVAVVLCETDTPEKEARFARVRRGGAAPNVPPLRVVMWIGDNMGDFPDLDQALRDAPAAALDGFGRRYFVLPNPMYGSWLRNPWR